MARLTSSTTPTTRKKVAIWLRVSTEESAKGESPAVHEARARAYAEARGWDVVDVYHLEGVSGKTVFGHKETLRMVGAVKSHAITALLFSKLARLCRNTKELLEIAEIFQRYGADLISVQEAIDTSTPGGRLFFTVLAAVAQWEREEISQRIRASVPIRASLGRPTNGNATFGYKWIEKGLVPDCEKAPVRKLIYYLFACHRRLKTVARLLNSAGYRTAHGACFTDRTVRRLIKDSTPAGLHRSNYTTLGNKGSVLIKPANEWVMFKVEPIVCKELWEFCNQLLHDRDPLCRPGRKAVHAFGGLVWCRCGKKMYVASNNPKYVCPQCHKKLPKAELEQLFTDFVSSHPPQLLNQVLSSWSPSETDLSSLQQLVEQCLAQISKETSLLFALKAEGLISNASYECRTQTAKLRQKQLAGELARLTAELCNLKMRSESESRANSNGASFHNMWSNLPSPTKHQIVEAMVARVVVGDTVTFALRRDATGANTSSRHHNSQP